MNGFSRMAQKVAIAVQRLRIAFKEFLSWQNLVRQIGVEIYVLAGLEQVHKEVVFWLDSGQGAGSWLDNNWSPTRMDNHLIKLDSFKWFSARPFAAKASILLATGKACVYLHGV